MKEQDIFGIIYDITCGIIIAVVMTYFIYSNFTNKIT